MSMDVIKSVLHWMRVKIRKIREFASGDDLYDAQSHRSDHHEAKSIFNDPGM